MLCPRIAPPPAFAGQFGQLPGSLVLLPEPAVSAHAGLGEPPREDVVHADPGEARETEDDGRLGPYRWSTIEHVEGRTIHQVHSQKRVEQIAALAYTAPFAVEVVSDVAIALANERVRHAIRNGT